FSSSSTQPNKFINAYVNNGTLVVVYTGTITLHVVLPAPGLVSGPLAITLVKPTLTAKLVPNGNGGWDLQDGVIVGRWARSDILSNVASLTFDGGALCDSTGVFAVVGQTVCQDQDITASGQDDNTIPCDAISLAIAFDGVAADVP